MALRGEYLFSEVITGLRRNMLMTLATIITITVSLMMLGAGLWTHFQVEKAERVLNAQVEISIFLVKGIPEEQKNSIEQMLHDNPLVKEVIFESQEEAYKKALEQFANDPEILKTLTPTTLPPSFRVKLYDPQKYEAVASEFCSPTEAGDTECHGVPGVEEVVDQREILGPFFDIMNVVRDGAIAVALLQLLAAAALISNTIRLTAFARREQTGIMKLVGASNWYIRLPFMLEGITAGALGALAAGLIMIAGDVFLLSIVKRKITFFPFLTTVEVSQITPFLLMVGVLVAVVASFFSLRRFLDV
jgi:cell division transport system permease protein